MQNPIPLFKVYMSPEAPERVAEVLRSGYIGQGKIVEQFEEKLQTIFNCPVRPLTVNAGTSALTLALHLVGAGPGTEVVSTPMTCLATNTPIRASGAQVVWADVDPNTGLIDPEDVSRVVGPRTKAIMAVDWCGTPCNYSALRKFGIPIIEDAAHAILSRVYVDGHVGDLHVAAAAGDYVCFSLQAIKHLTTGDGGLLVVPREQYQRAKLLRWYGFDRDCSESFRCAQNVKELGYKFHMNDINAAIGLANLEHTVEIVETHRQNAKFYDRNIDNPLVKLIPFHPYSSYWIYTILVADIPSFTAYMQSCGVVVSPVHRRNDDYDALRGSWRPLPGVDEFFRQQVAIPVGWWVTPEDREKITGAVNSWRPKP